MNNNSLLRVFYVLIIIVGGIIIIIGKPTPPEPPCLACGSNLINLLGIAEMILGIGAFVVSGRVGNVGRGL